jgi:hypothetical protein
MNELKKLISIKFFILVLISLLLVSCDNKESINDDSENEKQENIDTPVIEKYKVNLTLEEIHYGAKYCLSVAKQMKKDGLEPCNKLDELLIKAISNSKIALAYNELQKALDYFKKAEKNLYMAVDSQDDCGIRKYIKPTNI